MYREGTGYALWCLIFVGLGGVHRIYLGRYGTGILWLLTGGLFLIGQFVDLVRMKALVRDANVRDGYLPHPRLAHLLEGGEGAGVGRRAEAAPGDPTEEEMMRALVKAAEENGGAISVTQAVAATGLPFERAEEILTSMLESGYVDVENAPDTGVVLYRFPELR